MSLLGSIYKTREEIEREIYSHEKYFEQEQQRAMAAQKNYAAAASSMKALGAQSVYSNQAQTSSTKYPFNPVKRFDPNTHEAFNVPLEHLVTMWRLKYGDRWYDATEVRGPEEYDFYQGAFMRLKYAKMFESFDGWYRLKEGLA